MVVEKEDRDSRSDMNLHGGRSTVRQPLPAVSCDQSASEDRSDADNVLCLQLVIVEKHRVDAAKKMRRDIEERLVG
jgi:hypothetical protein